MKIIFSCFVLVLALTAANSKAFVQKETATGVDVERDLALLRRDIRAEKKQLVAMNLPLTETEATRFWPVYDQYVAEMTRHNDEFYGLIKDYAANQKVITDAQAGTMIKRWAEIQIEQLRHGRNTFRLSKRSFLREKRRCFSRSTAVSTRCSICRFHHRSRRLLSRMDS